LLGFVRGKSTKPSPLPNTAISFILTFRALAHKINCFSGPAPPPRGNQSAYASPKYRSQERTMREPAFSPYARQTYQLFSALALVCVLLLCATPSANAQGSTIGQWGSPIQIGVTGIHAALLNNGNVLLWTYSVRRSTGPTIAKIFNPTTQTTVDASPTFNVDFYCGGMTFLADGTLFDTGGQDENGINRGGVQNTEFFNPANSTWTQGPDMTYGRWYPTNVLLPDGSVLILSGFDSEGLTNVHPMEQYYPDTDAISVLPASANTPSNTDTYPRMHVLPTGQIFNSGQRSDTQMYDPVAQKWSFVSNSNFGKRQEGTSVLLPGLEKVLAAGGTHTQNAGGATNTAELIDFTQAKPKWAYTGSMTYARYNHNLVLLADGTVLAVGGNTSGIYNSPVEQAELYDPSTGKWTVMASQQANRAHHSVAVLLPDGTVLSAGSDSNTSLDKTVEIFSPPYLFKGSRPTITSAPTFVSYGATFSISAPNATNITRVALIKPGVDTHDNNFDQRYVDLTFTTNGGTITATAPASGNYAPPGYYMLVIVNSSGVPSVMPFLQLNTSENKHLIYNKLHERIPHPHALHNEDRPNHAAGDAKDVRPVHIM
jgi:hypothetical protein